MRLPEPASRALRALKRTQIPVYAGKDRKSTRLNSSH